MKRTIVTAALLLASASAHAQAVQTFTFQMTVSTGASNCLPNASGTVTDHTFGPVENLEVVVSGLPPNTDFDLFTIEVPTAPFGLAWYMGDIETDANGVGVGNFVGRFSVETFIISPGNPSPPAPPNVFKSPPAVVSEATTGVQTNPVQIYHLGLWFNSATDAGNAGCPNTATPFNGEHNAGIQVLNTAKFPVNKGPLFNLK
jgi:hypothetical protein